MSEISQATHDNDQINIGRAQWGAVILSIVGVSSFVLGLYLVSRNPVWQVYGVALIAFVSMVIDIVCLMLIRQGRAAFSLKLLFISGLLTIPLNAIFLENVTTLLIGLVLIVSFGEIFFIFPKSWRNRALIGPFVASVVMLTVEFLNPPFRLALVSTTLFFGPAAIAFMIVAFAVVIFRQAWSGSIRTRLLASFLMLVILPLAISAVISSIFIRRAAIADAYEHLSAVATLKENRLNDWQNNMFNALDIVFHEDEEIALANTLLRGNPSADGYQEVYDVVEANLESAINRTNYFNELFLLDEQGLVILSTDTDQLGKFFSNQSIFQEGLKGAYVQPPTYSQAFGKIVIWVGRPLHDENNNSVGIIVGRANTDILSEFMLQDIGIGETGETYLVRSNHALLTASKFEGYETDSTYIRTEGINIAIENFQNGIATYTGYRGTEVLGAYRWLPGLQVALVAEVEQDEVLGAASTSTVTNTGVAVGAAILAVLAAFLVTRTIANPLGELVGAAGRLATGELDVVVEMYRQDEIGTLGNAFNDMAHQLTDLIATLEQRVAERTKDQSTVAEIAIKTASIPDLQEMLATMVHLTQRGFGLYHAHVFLYQEDAGELQIVACGYKEGDEHEGTHGTTSIPLAQEQSLVARAARTRQPVIVNDVRSDPGWLPNPLLPDTHSEMAVPMIMGDKLLGVLDVQAEQIDAFDDADATIQMTLAAQVAVAVQNILQFRTSQKVAADLSVVADVGIATSTITDREHLLQEVVDLSKASFNLYHAHIYLLDEEGDKLQLAAGAGEVGRQMVAEGRSIALDSEKSLVARAARTHQGVVVNNVTEDPDFLPHSLLPDTRAEMAVPMIVAGNVIGVLDVQSEIVGRFTETDVNIQTTLASQVAVALENARSFEEAQKQAEHETKLNLITQRIQDADTIEEALQVAARELGHALGKKQTLVALDPSALSGGSHVEVAEEAAE